MKWLKLFNVSFCFRFFLFLCKTNRCICPPGHTGKNCESKYTPCSPSQCQNGGTCKRTSQFSYECKCPPGKNSSTFFVFNLFLFSFVSSSFYDTHLIKQQNSNRKHHTFFFSSRMIKNSKLVVD